MKKLPAIIVAYGAIVLFAFLWGRLFFSSIILFIAAIGFFIATVFGITIYGWRRLNRQRLESQRHFQTELEYLYGTSEGIRATYEAVKNSTSSVQISAAILIYAGTKSALLRDRLQETLKTLRDKSILDSQEKAPASCFDDIFVEVAALCFGFLLGKHRRGESNFTESKYSEVLEVALYAADGLFFDISQAKKPEHYLTRRVFSYTDAASGVPIFDSFNTRILSSVLPEKNLMFELATAFLTQQAQITFVTLDPDELEVIARELYADSVPT